jgi:hypothetical protein
MPASVQRDRRGARTLGATTARATANAKDQLATPLRLNVLTSFCVEPATGYPPYCGAAADAL